MIKPDTYKLYVHPDTCAKSGGVILKNVPGKAKIDRFFRWSIMRILIG